MAVGSIGEGDLLSLIDRIYESGLDLGRWPDTLARLSALAGAVCTEIYVLHGDDLLFASHGGLPDHVMEEYLARYHGRTKRSILLPQAPQGTLLTDFDFMTEREMKRDPFYEEFMRALDVRHFLGWNALNTPQVSALLATEMPLRAGSPEAPIYSFARAVMPHIRRAVLVQTKLAGARLHERRLADCIDTLAPGIVLLDVWGKVRFANATVRDIFTRSGALGVRQNRLVTANRAEGRRLERLVASALGPAPALAPAGGIMTINGPARRRPLSILVSPLPIERRTWDGIAAIVFVSDPEREPETPENLLIRIYGLTAAEARLAQALVAGEHLNDIAEHLGITKETARSQLKAVFAKTGTHGQADLMRLVLENVGSVAPRGAEGNGRTNRR